MQAAESIEAILKEACAGRAITQAEAKMLLSLPENSMDAAATRNAANMISRRRFGNRGLLLGQIGVDMAPCLGDCAFCFFAKSHTQIKPSVLSAEEIIRRCERFAAGGASGVFLMTMHRFGFEWFLNLCATLRRQIPASMKILANVGDISLNQLQELRDAGIAGAYHVCRLREGIDSRMSPVKRCATIDRIIEAGLDWYTLCEPVGPEHTPTELAEQIWLGVDRPCRQHGVMQRFPVPGSPLFSRGQISVQRLNQIAAVVALATIGKPEIQSIAINVTNLAGLFSGANAFFPEQGEPETEIETSPKGGFTTALWRRGTEITTADCRGLFDAAGFSGLQ
jgi:biotin synthase